MTRPNSTPRHALRYGRPLVGLLAVEIAQAFPVVPAWAAERIGGE